LSGLVFLRGLWELKRLDEDVWTRFLEKRNDNEDDDDAWRSLPFDELMTQLQIQHIEDEKESDRIMRLDNVFDVLDTIDQQPRHFGWAVDKHRLSYRIHDDRSLGKIFDDIVLRDKGH
jgi:hypothetical protein